MRLTRSNSLIIRKRHFKGESSSGSLSDSVAGAVVPNSFPVAIDGGVFDHRGASTTAIHDQYPNDPMSVVDRRSFLCEIMFSFITDPATDGEHRTSFVRQDPAGDDHDRRDDHESRFFQEDPAANPAADGYHRALVRQEDPAANRAADGYHRALVLNNSHTIIRIGESPDPPARVARDWTWVRAALWNEETVFTVFVEIAYKIVEAVVEVSRQEFVFFITTYLAGFLAMYFIFAGYMISLPDFSITRLSSYRDLFISRLPGFSSPRLPLSGCVQLFAALVNLMCVVLLNYCDVEGPARHFIRVPFTLVIRVLARFAVRLALFEPRDQNQD